MPTLQISPKFFKKERDMYSYWPFAFWREFFQNSIDAGSRRIDITLQQEGCSAWVDFVDNGCGFGKQIRDEVYFVLGETSKDGIGTVGGRGRARIITNFAHTQYELWSHDWYACGQGGQYSCQDHVWTKGCKVRVNVDATRHGVTVDMMEALELYLLLAQLNCDVCVNGRMWTSWCYRRRKVCALSFGDVYANKSGGENPNSLIVRVSGTPMFTRWIGGGIQVVLEMTPEQSQDVLLSNRDNLTVVAANELDNFILSLTTKRSAILRSNVRRELHIGDEPHVTHRLNRKLPQVLSLQDAVATAIKGSEAAFAPNKGINHVGADISAQRLSDIDDAIVQYKVDRLVPTAVIVCESSNSNVRKVVDSYNPQNWGMVHWDKRPDNPYMKGRVKRDLLRLWTVAIDAVLEHWLEIIDVETMSWVPGFIFSDEDDAMHQNTRETHRFLVNPVDRNGKMKFSIRQRADWGRLVALACHEVVHSHFSGHDESFATMLTELDMATRGRTAEIFRKMKAVLKKKKD